MAPRGKTPSLIGSGAGNSRFAKAIKKRTCKRCETELPGGTDCIEVAIPGSFGSRTYCKECFAKIIEQSKKDLAALETKLAQI